MDIKIEERLLVLYKAMHDVQNYFVHWESIPYIEIDELYKEYIKKVMDTDSRYEFAMVMKEFMAKFKNTHTWYNDLSLRNKYGGSLPFHAIYHDYKKVWVVLSSTNKEITPGTIIKCINGEKLEAVYKRKKVYLSASSDRMARNGLFEYPWLFPQRFSITTNDNRVIKITRSDKNSHMHKRVCVAKKISEDIAYVSIPSFSSKNAVKDATKCIKKFKKYKKLIIDLRGNEGGNTPIQLIKSLMNKKYRRFCYTKVLLEDAVSIMMHNINGKKVMHHYKIEKSVYKNPIKNSYSGKLVILVDQTTMSAAEDFVFPFKDNKRAKIIGIKTAGSNGNTYVDNYKNEIFIGVGSVGVTFPDGSRFEGRGIKPDKEVYPSIRNIKDGKDVILEAAIKMLKFV
ncbi:MAG: S41 family peptidase [Candidatus Marsarchaeota archaeon]|nr:S41 family peptidase [Candidatus Marsarchaeota archaeon]